MIKAVLFDFDETLQDRTEAFEHYMDTFLDTYRPELTQAEREQCKEDMRITGKGGYVNRVEWCKLLTDMWGWKDAPPAEELANHYDRTFGDHNVIFKNSAPVMEELKKRGYTVGVVTNGPSYLQNHKMDMSGLRQYCDIVVVSGDVGVHKPDPELLRYSARLLNLAPEECIYVGDHPINDIKCAIEAGMKPIRMNHGWFENQDLLSDVPVINDIIEVLNYV